MAEGNACFCFPVACPSCGRELGEYSLLSGGWVVCQNTHKYANACGVSCLGGEMENGVME